MLNFPGVFDECVRSKSVSVANHDSTCFHGKYCLIGLHPMVKNTGKELYVSDIPPELTALLLRFATCIPSKCSENDALLGDIENLHENFYGGQLLSCELKL